MSSVENLPPLVIKKISMELQDLLQTPPEGIKVFLNEENITDVEAAILGPDGTPYAGGVFRVKLVLPSDFPNSPPKGFFLTKIFHPNVSSNGDICVSTLKKDWKKDLGIKHILLTIKCLLIVPNPESALNEEAGKLLLEKYEDFVKHAKMITGIHAPNKGEFKVAEGEEEKGDEAMEGGEEASSKKRTAEKLDKQKAEKKKNLKRL